MMVDACWNTLHFCREVDSDIACTCRTGIRRRTLCGGLTVSSGEECTKWGRVNASKVLSIQALALLIGCRRQMQEELAPVKPIP